MTKLEQLKEQAIAAGKYDDHSRKVNQPSRPIVWSRNIVSPLFDIVLSDICNEIEGKEGRKRKRSIRAQHSFTTIVKALILDLYVTWKSNKRMQLGIPLNKSDLSASSNRHKIVKFYQSVSLSYRGVKSAYEGLEACGYLKAETKGYFAKEKSKGKRTRIRATQKLISILEEQAHINLWAVQYLEGRNNIVLKDDNKNIITYEHNNDTTQMSNNLQRINRLLSNTLIDLDLKDTEFGILNDRVYSNHLKDNEKPPSIDFSARTLKRVFNKNSWYEGGRFYGAWWQGVPSEYRKYIHIDGKETVELDYSGMHPAMLYAQIGVTPPLDPYDMGLHKVDRKVKKVAFNALINASNTHINPHSDFNAEQAGCTWNELLDAIIDAHQPIKKFFGSGEGLRLQKKDADIAERVILKFAVMGYACLPVHDSFIVHHALADELKEHMELCYQEVIGVAANVDVKPVITYNAPTEPQFLDMEDLDDLYGGGEYSEYNKRADQWYSLMDYKVGT